MNKQRNQHLRFIQDTLLIQKEQVFYAEESYSAWDKGNLKDMPLLNLTGKPYNN